MYVCVWDLSLLFLILSFKFELFGGCFEAKLQHFFQSDTAAVSIMSICSINMLLGHPIKELAVARVQEFVSSYLAATQSSCQRHQLSLEPDTPDSFSSVYCRWVCDEDYKPSILLHHQRYISHLSAAICPSLRVLNPSSVSTFPSDEGCDPWPGT